MTHFPVTLTGTIEMPGAGLPIDPKALEFLGKFFGSSQVIGSNGRMTIHMVAVPRTETSAMVATIEAVTLGSFSTDGLSEEALDDQATQIMIESALEMVKARLRPTQ